MTFNKGFTVLKVDIFSMIICIVVTDVVKDVTCSRKSVNTRVAIILYYMTLSPGKQRRHKINQIGHRVVIHFIMQRESKNFVKIAHPM